MEIPLNPSPPTGTVESLRLEATTGSSQGLLQRLQQLGSFRAQVVQSEGTRVLLDTAFGQLRGEPGSSSSSTLQTYLRPGDVIEARLQLSDNRPLLSILQHRPLQQVMRQPELFRQLQQASHALLAGRVLQNETGQRLLSIGREQYALSHDTRLQPGDTVLLRPGVRSGEVHMQPVQPRPLLLQALSRLLPKQAAVGDSASGSSLPRLQQLVARILQPSSPAQATAPAPSAANTAHSASSSSPSPLSAGSRGVTGSKGTPPAQGEVQTQAPATAVAGKSTPLESLRQAEIAQTLARESAPLKPGNPLPPAPSNTAPDTHARTATGTPAEANSGRLQALLQPLLKLGIAAERLTPEQLQNSLAQLGLVRSPATTVPPAVDLLSRLIELQALLRDQPELFERLLRAHATSATTTTDGQERGLPEDWPQWRQQFSQQLEQGINQLMLGKTGLRLQQDQQQPYNLNLVLPLQLPEQPSRELRLQLQQRPDTDNPEQPAWDVRLSFEFGLLGLITVHVLLQESRISAHFWAVEENTWRMIGRELPAFKNQLQRNGFELGLFDCFRGQPITDQPQPPAAGDGNLLDVEA